MMKKRFLIRECLELDRQYINEFRLKNEKNRIYGASSFEGGDGPSSVITIMEEHYFINNQLVVLLPATESMIVLEGGILDDLK